MRLASPCLRYPIAVAQGELHASQRQAATLGMRLGLSREKVKALQVALAAATSEPQHCSDGDSVVLDDEQSECGETQSAQLDRDAAHIQQLQEELTRCGAFSAHFTSANATSNAHPSNWLVPPFRLGATWMLDLDA